jgi:hypothetical protein
MPDLATPTLVIALLATESSLQRNIERPARGTPDTVQIWITPQRQWRARTYAIDRSAQVHAIEAPPGDPVAFAREHLQRHYGDVLDRLIVVQPQRKPGLPGVKLELTRLGLDARLGSSPPGLPYWAPGSGAYRVEPAAAP